MPFNRSRTRSIVAPALSPGIFLRTQHVEQRFRDSGVKQKEQFKRRFAAVPIPGGGFVLLFRRNVLRCVFARQVAQLTRISVRTSIRAGNDRSTDSGRFELVSRLDRRGVWEIRA